MAAPKLGYSHGFLQPKTLDRAMIAADPAAALVGYVSTILATFGLFELMGLSADQVAILGGAVLGLVATLRVFYERARRAAHQELQDAHEELKRKTGSSLKKEDFASPDKPEKPTEA